MDMNAIISLLISLVSGAAGGNIAGALMKQLSLGKLGNSIAGIVGGGIGGKVLALLGILQQTAAAGNLDITNILGNVGSGGVGGAILMMIIGFIRKAMAPSK